MGDAQGEATHLLQECDAVISDYSSVAIDALLFDRRWRCGARIWTAIAAERPLPYFDFRDDFRLGIRGHAGTIAGVARRPPRVAAPSMQCKTASPSARSLFHQHARGGAGERVLQAHAGAIGARRSE